MRFNNLREWAVGQKILASDFQNITDRLNATTPLSFTGNVQVKGGFKEGMAVYIPPPPPIIPVRFRWAKILSADSLGSNRWAYHFSWQDETSDNWQDADDASDPEDNGWLAYNSVEANNSGSGIQGNSIDHDDPDYPAGFSLQPVRGSPVVLMKLGTDVDGNPTFRFQYENAEQGACS